MDRIYDFIRNEKISTKYICLANDEDIIISSYFENSIRFLEKNDDYSGYYGSVLTLLKPLFFIPRLNLYKSSPPNNIKIDSEKNVERLITYLTLNSNIALLLIISLTKSPF